ncbi:MAG: hypothetical protein NC923_02520 [Candidatus Omnitrophica bacterium]|nr:hypothetical protein [Candidatus Omnitrophota bacterium]
MRNLERKITYFVLFVYICGCSSFKESCRGFLGVSTKVLEDERKNAVSEEFDCLRPQCYELVKKALSDHQTYIYYEDKSKNTLALYVSEEDTTPVGIFFKDTARGKTQVEISSPSTYAKELIAKIIFADLKKYCNSR